MSNFRAPRVWLSAIVPSHNGERWLAAALASVAAQEDPGIEVIVVDSSDTLASLAIVKHFADRLNIRVHRRPDLASWMAKTNFAAEIADGDWLCMLHQDDLWLSGRCSRVREWVEARPDAAMHVHTAYIIDERGKRLGIWRCPLPGGDRPVPAALILERLLVQEFIAIPSPTIRREAFLRIGGLDKRLPLTADWDLYLKLLPVGAVYYHALPLACFRIHPDSMTMSETRGRDYRAQLETVLERHSGKLTRRHRETLQMARASIDINLALAAASNGDLAQLGKVAAALFRLGPRRMLRYLQYSRIVERAYPRLRARLAGAL